MLSLGRISKRTRSLFKRLIAVEKYFAEKPDTARFRIWYNVDETSLDTVLMDEIAASILRIQGHIVKIAFIGLGRIQQWRFTAKLQSKKGCLPFPYEYFADAEKAKEWLI